MSQENSDRPAKLDDLEKVFFEAMQKFAEGERKHGPFSPEDDTRDLLEETKTEILDAINYLGMFFVQLDRINENTKALLGG